MKQKLQIYKCFSIMKQNLTSYKLQTNIISFVTCKLVYWCYETKIYKLKVTKLIILVTFSL
jgi:hypothetical protein